MERQESENSEIGGQPWFPGTRLPRFSELESYQRDPQFLASVSEVPKLRNQEVNDPGSTSRGAPVKAKNRMAAFFNFRNTKGKKFKFSFICQILISHLQHMFGLKNKLRHQKDNWLRSDTPEGRGIQAMMREVIDGQPKILNFKRVVSIKELKAWLNGKLMSKKLNCEKAKNLRFKVFRLLCILKCIDLENRFTIDFSVGSSNPLAGHVFRKYITEFLWQELGYPEITDDEISETFEAARRIII